MTKYPTFLTIRANAIGRPERGPMDGPSIAEAGCVRQYRPEGSAEKGRPRQAGDRP